MEEITMARKSKCLQLETNSGVRGEAYAYLSTNTSALLADGRLRNFPKSFIFEFAI